MFWNLNASAYKIWKQYSLTTVYGCIRYKLQIARIYTNYIVCAYRNIRVGSCDSHSNRGYLTIVGV